MAAAQPRKIAGGEEKKVYLLPFNPAVIAIPKIAEVFKPADWIGEGKQISGIPIGWFDPRIVEIGPEPSQPAMDMHLWQAREDVDDTTVGVEIPSAIQLTSLGQMMYIIGQWRSTVPEQGNEKFSHIHYVKSYSDGEMRVITWNILNGKLNFFLSLQNEK
jgi:hypothetical protein